MNTYRTLSKHLLYADAVENDGRLEKQYTFLGSVLVILGGALILAAIVALVIYGGAALQ